MNRTDKGWDRLERALGDWTAARGEPASFWLRDDDAAVPSPALDRLLDIAGGAGIPVSLAVTPALAGSPLAAFLSDKPDIAVLQHGFAHADHARPGEKSSEFGAHRDPAQMRGEIAEGRRRLSDFAGFVPIFVPPWNRIAAAAAADLPGLGLPIVSGYAGRREPQPVVGLARLDTHIDPVAWHAGRGLLAPAALLAKLAERVERLARSPSAPAEPTGILTHHLVHDDATFAFVDALLHFLARGGLTRWLSGAMLLEKFGRDEGTVAE